MCVCGGGGGGGWDTLSAKYAVTPAVEKRAEKIIYVHIAQARFSNFRAAFRAFARIARVASPPLLMVEFLVLQPHSLSLGHRIALLLLHFHHTGVQTCSVGKCVGDKKRFSFARSSNRSPGFCIHIT